MSSSSSSCWVGEIVQTVVAPILAIAFETRREQFRQPMKTTWVLLEKVANCHARLLLRCWHLVLMLAETPALCVHNVYKTNQTRKVYPPQLTSFFFIYMVVK